MSNDYISGLLEAQAEGKLDTYNPAAPVTLEPEENVPTDLSIETEANTVKPEVDLEQVKEITEEFSTLDKFGIYGQAFGGEIITNVATTATLIKGLGYLNDVKNIFKNWNLSTRRCFYYWRFNYLRRCGGYWRCSG